MNLDQAVDRYMDENELYRLEGRRGVENFAKVCRVLGYKDFSSYGQMQGGACLGDIFEFLGDNPGCTEAMLEWIKSQRNPEWTENVVEQLRDQSEDPDDDDYGG